MQSSEHNVNISTSKSTPARHLWRRPLLFLAAFALSGALATSPAAAQSAADRTAAADPASIVAIGRSDQITRLYRTALGREADQSGHAYWMQRLAEGESVYVIAAQMMRSPEAAARTNGDPVLDAYLWALGRIPDESGYAYWSSQDPVRAVVAISDSAEHQAATATVAPPPPSAPPAADTAAAPATAHPQGWVDTGNGVFVPPVLITIRYCESKDNYLAANRTSTARGAYQFLRSSWYAYGHADRYGVSEAHLATPAQQDEAALITWGLDGTRPWLASRHCWK